MVYFVSDVHLGLKGTNPQERENRFVDWLKSIPRRKGDKLFLLGDIWDFWYEYKDVIPKEGQRVVAQFIDLLDNGVEIHYFIGNHDIWCFHYFESLGIKMYHNQPVVMELEGKKLLLAHGDTIGGGRWKYDLMLKIFHSRFCQFLFSLLHPRLAFSIATRWSKTNRCTHKPYVWKGADEPLYKFALSQCTDEPLDLFIFGHYHCEVNQTLPNGAKLIVLKDWISGGTPYFTLDKS